MICVPVIETEMAFITRCCTMLCLLVVLTTPNAATLTFHQGGYNHLQVALAPQTPVPNNCSQMLNQLEVKRKTKTNQNIKFFFFKYTLLLRNFRWREKEDFQKKETNNPVTGGWGGSDLFADWHKSRELFFFFFRKRLKSFVFFPWCLFHATWFWNKKKKNFFRGEEDEDCALHEDEAARCWTSLEGFFCLSGRVGRPSEEIISTCPNFEVLFGFPLAPPPPSVCKKKGSLFKGNTRNV